MFKLRYLAKQQAHSSASSLPDSFLLFATKQPESGNSSSLSLEFSWGILAFNAPFPSTMKSRSVCFTLH